VPDKEDTVVRFLTGVRNFPLLQKFQVCSAAHPAPVALFARIKVSERKANHSLQFGADFKNNLKESSISPCPFTARGGTPLPYKTTLQRKDNFVPHKLKTCFNYQLNAQFVYSITIYMLHYNP
jgi:hypothetical protein